MYLGKGVENFNEQPVAPGRMWMTDNEQAEIIEFGGDASCPSEETHIADIREALDKSSGVTPIAAGAIKNRIGLLFSPGDTTFTSLIGSYESDFGVCRIAMSRWVPVGTVLLLDSSRVDVMPLAGRSFHYKPLGVSGDRESGQVIGEYTLELRNENAHGVISGLTD